MNPIDVNDPLARKRAERRIPRRYEGLLRQLFILLTARTSALLAADPGRGYLDLAHPGWQSRYYYRDCRRVDSRFQRILNPQTGEQEPLEVQGGALVDYLREARRLEAEARVWGIALPPRFTAEQAVAIREGEALRRRVFRIEERIRGLEQKLNPAAILFDGDVWVLYRLTQEPARVDWVNGRAEVLVRLAKAEEYLDYLVRMTTPTR
ncbi:MAG: hypothetical protein WC764_02155 [Candidatus Paceibacterota bacterium]|jgi:hypothetical protein